MDQKATAAAAGETLVSIGEDWPEIRESVRAICAKFPGSFWRDLEKSADYPDAFVKDMNDAGYLAAVIPEAYGGSGLPLRAGGAILEEIHASGCDAYACHAQMYMMAMLLRHGSDAQKNRYLPKIATGEIRFQAFGVTEPTTGSDTLKLRTMAVRDGDHYVVNGQKIWTSRTRHSDLMTLLVRMTPKRITISEVGPRDGLQMEKRILSVDEKLSLINALAATGLTRIEVTGFVSPKVIPQFADAMELSARLPRLGGVRYAAFIPNAKGAERAVAAGIDDLKCGIATSDTFNQLNVRMTTEEGVRSLHDIAASASGTGSRIVGVVATAFGCPYKGAVAFDTVHRLFANLVGLGAGLIYLADTTGVADPTLITQRVDGLQKRYPQTRVGLHLHNTRGLGLANALAGLQCGVTDFESSIGGLGGCPFAPLAVGNICTEDFVHMAHRIGIGTGLDLERLIAVARQTQDLLGRTLPGMVLKAGPADHLHLPAQPS